MVDVSGKQITTRTASARAFVTCQESTLQALRQGTIPKGDALAVARIAAINATKSTPALLPLAHPIGVHGCEVRIDIENERIALWVQVRATERTGVEMEALTGACVGALALVDMLKGIDRTVRIETAEVLSKSGGRSGDWYRYEQDRPVTEV